MLSPLEILIASVRDDILDISLERNSRTLSSETSVKRSSMHRPFNNIIDRLRKINSCAKRTWSIYASELHFPESLQLIDFEPKHKKVCANKQPSTAAVNDVSLPSNFLPQSNNIAGSSPLEVTFIKHALGRLCISVLLNGLPLEDLITASYRCDIRLDKLPSRTQVDQNILHAHLSRVLGVVFYSNGVRECCDEQQAARILRPYQSVSPPYFTADESFSRPSGYQFRYMVPGEFCVKHGSPISNSERELGNVPNSRHFLLDESTTPNIRLHSDPFETSGQKIYCRCGLKYSSCYGPTWIWCWGCRKWSHWKCVRPSREKNKKQDETILVLKNQNHSEFGRAPHDFNCLDGKCLIAMSSTL